MDVSVLPTSQRDSYDPAQVSELTFELPDVQYLAGTARLNFSLNITAAGCLDPYAGAYGVFREIRTSSRKTGVIDNCRVDHLAAAMTATSGYKKLCGFSTVTEAKSGGSLSIARARTAAGQSMTCSLDLGKFAGIFAQDCDYEALGQVRLQVTINSNADAVGSAVAGGTYTLSGVELKLRKSAENVGVPRMLAATSTLSFTMRSARSLASFQLQRPTFALLATCGVFSPTAGISHQALVVPPGLQKIIFTHRGEQRPEYVLEYSANDGVGAAGTGNALLFSDLATEFARAASVSSLEGARVAALTLRTGLSAPLGAAPANSAMAPNFGFGRVLMSAEKPVGMPGEQVQVAVEATDINDIAANRRVLYIHRRELIPMV